MRRELITIPPDTTFATMERLLLEVRTLALTLNPQPSTLNRQSSPSPTLTPTPSPSPSPMACVPYDLQGDTGRLHVVDGEGRLLGLVSRTDMLRHFQMYNEAVGRRV